MTCNREVWLVFLFFVFVGWDFDLRVDEIGAATLFSSATAGSRSAFLVATPAQGSRPVVDLYVYNHEKDLAQRIDDGRVNLSSTCRLFPIDQGFVVVSPVDKMVHCFDRDGAFLDQYSIDTVATFKPYDVITKVGTLSEGTVSITYVDLEHKVRHLASLDLTKRIFTTLHSEKKEHGFWLKSQDTWLFVDDITGQIDALAADFQPTKTLVKGLAPVLIEKRPWVQKLLEERGVSPYIPRVEGLFLSESSISLWIKTIPEDYPREKPDYYQLEVFGGCKRSENAGVLKLGGPARLFFDQVEGVFGHH